VTTRRAAPLAAAGLLLGGCTVFSGSPDPIRNIDDDLRALAPIFAPTAVVDCISGTAEGGPPACRDRIVQAQGPEFADKLVARMARNVERELTGVSHAGAFPWRATHAVCPTSDAEPRMPGRSPICSNWA